ncbi:hypothetical protein EVAR_22195_1 [Eumeta japonica]|uniref:Uncharacterized protein n=1 Tax=Eumeta variegata TaxID=151549 RepID=A0A4C1UAJ7_EUMVA|nr:hypothetical protein EVAR_22195_1 [Eumeta japonica]
MNGGSGVMASESSVEKFPPMETGTSTTGTLSCEGTSVVIRASGRILPKRYELKPPRGIECCALANRRLRIKTSVVHSCSGEKNDPETTIDTCH